MPSVRRAFRNYLITGVLVLAPLVITAYVLVSGFAILDRQLADAVEYLLGRRVPGVGAVLTVSIAILVGMIATNVVGRRIIAVWDGLFERIPIVRSVYSSVKQVIQAFGAQDRSAFQKVVLVEHPRRGLWSVGFVTNQAGGSIERALAQKSVMVFIPTSPNPTTGFLVIVPEDEVVPLDLTVEGAFKLIVSGGFALPLQADESAKASDGQMTAR